MHARLLALLHLLLAPWHPAPLPTVAPPAVALSKSQVASLMPELLSRNVLEATPQWTAGGRRLAAQLTLRADLQKRLLAVLQASRADYVAVAAIDARTGAVKCLLSRSPEASPTETKPMASLPMVLRAAFPSASVFKLVTAAAAIDTHQARPETAIAFRGGDHELYHFSVRETANGKRMRRLTLREAFAHSVNPVFARLGTEAVGAARLADYARRFGFGVALPADFPVETGQVGLTEAPPGGWAVAETASGYNWRTQMSAVQAAVFTGAMANDGVAMEPFIADTVITAKGDVLYRGRAEPWHALVSPLDQSPASGDLIGRGSPPYRQQQLLVIQSGDGNPHRAKRRAQFRLRGERQRRSRRDQAHQHRQRQGRGSC